MASTTSSSQSRSVPQLLFDDGSRAVFEDSSSSLVTRSNPRKKSDSSIHEFYEIDRLAKEIRTLPQHERVAIQFPDEMLEDSPMVCWEFEKILPDHCWVFVLGDTTYAPCCPDYAAAAHLNADCMIHYGHACLSPCTSIPVLYSFGKADMNVQECASKLKEKLSSENCTGKKILLFYSLEYHHAISDLEALLQEENILVQVAKIPERTLPIPVENESSLSSSACCHQGNRDEESCCQNSKPPSTHVKDEKENTLDESANTTDLNIGGLHISQDDGEDDTERIVVYIGDYQSRQFLNIVLRYISQSKSPAIWTYDPTTKEIDSSLSSSLFQKILNRRFFLIQKVRSLSVFGILVANLSDTFMRSIVKAIQNLLRQHGRTSYTFVVGKINPAKIANFAEIEAFCLVACPEHSLLENERDFPVPIVTPLELGMALGLFEWGSVDYSLNSKDFLVKEVAENVPVAEGSDDDTPYYNLATGQYESKPTPDEGINLRALPGQGKLTTYRSAASTFLQQREYQGLEVRTGQTEAQGASQGDVGIASNYEER